MKLSRTEKAGIFAGTAAAVLLYLGGRPLYDEAHDASHNDHATTSVYDQASILEATGRVDKPLPETTVFNSNQSLTAPERTIDEGEFAAGSLLLAASIGLVVLGRERRLDGEFAALVSEQEAAAGPPPAMYSRH